MGWLYVVADTMGHLRKFWIKKDDCAEDIGTSPVEPVTFESVDELAMQLKSMSIKIENLGDGFSTNSQGISGISTQLLSTHLITCE